MPLQVEVEVQRNVYAPRETTVHSLSVAQDAACEVVNDVRQKLTHPFAKDPEAPFEHVLDNVRQRFEEGVEEAEGAISNVQEKAKHALSPSSSHNHPPEEDDEGWQSDKEGESSTAPAGEPRQKSRSPKPKPPKLTILRPAARRRSIRRGMLGARVLGRHYSDDGVLTRGSDLGAGVPESDAEEDDERGRRASLRSPASPLSPGGSGIGPRHARIDSLSRRSLREASPARSVRWADEDGGSTHGRASGANTPRVLSPAVVASPLPGSEAHSENEGEPPEGAVSPSHVRFSVPELPSHGSSRSS